MAWEGGGEREGRRERSVGLKERDGYYLINMVVDSICRHSNIPS